MKPNWTQEFSGAVTLSDATGKIVYMNQKASQVFEKQGGRKLVGKNLMDCHSASSRKRLQEMIQKQEKNIYTIEKKGVKKLIYQAPWYHRGAFAGLVELSLELPAVMPHFIRG
ncbi:MAG TPA: diguanylate cyclase [bacterium]|nr:diguanylate cyclase [bacterium]